MKFNINFKKELPKFPCFLLGKSSLVPKFPLTSEVY